MQVFDNLALEEVKSHDLDSSDIIRMILQELHQMGYDEACKILEHEAKLKLDNSTLNKESFLHGEYETILQNLDFSDAINKKLQYEIQKQLYIEIVELKNYEQAVNLLRQLSEFNEIESQDLAKLIFLQDHQNLLQQLKVPLNQSDQRLQLYQKSFNLINFGEFTLKTQFDRVIEQSFQYQYKKCPYHNEVNENTNQSLLRDHMCQVYEIPQNNTILYQSFDDEVWIGKFSNSGNYIGCATKNNSIYILSQAKQHKISKAHKMDINSLVFSNDDQLLFSASNDCEIHCYDVQTSQQKFIISQHTTAVLCLAYYKDQLFSGGVDGWLGVWNNNGKLNNQIKSKVVKNIMFSDQYMLLHNAAQFSITIIENDNKYTKTVTQLEEQELIVSSALSQNQQFLLLNVSKDNPKMHLWNLKTFQRIHIFSGFKGKGIEIKCCFGGKSDNFVCIGSQDGKLYFYNRNNQLEQQIVEAHKQAINFVDWNHNLLLTASDDKTVRIWSQEQQQQLIIMVSNENQQHLLQIEEQDEEEEEYQPQDEDD